MVLAATGMWQLVAAAWISAISVAAGIGVLSKVPGVSAFVGKLYERNITRPREERLAEQLRAHTAPLEAMFGDLATTVATVETRSLEWVNNGGGSSKDKLDQLVKDVGTIDRRTKRQGSTLTKHISQCDTDRATAEEVRAETFDIVRQLADALPEPPKGA